MVSYLTAAHMVDRHTMGPARPRNYIMLTTSSSPFCITPSSAFVTSSCADKNLRPNSKRAAKLRENTVMFDEMTPHLIMMASPPSSG